MDEKYLLIEKYKLKNENDAWYSERENSHKHLIFKNSFFERTDIIDSYLESISFVWQK